MAGQPDRYQISQNCDISVFLLKRIFLATEATNVSLVRWKETEVLDVWVTGSPFTIEMTCQLTTPSNMSQRSIDFIEYATLLKYAICGESIM